MAKLVVRAGGVLDPGLVSRVRLGHFERCGARAARWRRWGLRLLPFLVGGWLGFFVASVLDARAWMLLSLFFALPSLLVVVRSTFLSSAFEEDAAYLVRPLGVLLPGPSGGLFSPEHYSDHFGADLVALVASGGADDLPVSALGSEVYALALVPYLVRVLSASEREVFDVLFLDSPDVSLGELLDTARRLS